MTVVVSEITTIVSALTGLRYALPVRPSPFSIVPRPDGHREADFVEVE